MIPETKTLIKSTIKLWTVIISIVFCTVVFQLWVIAFYNGNSVLVLIDAYGEKWIELILWIVFFPFLTYGLILLIKQQLAESRKAKRRRYKKIGRMERL